MSGSRARAREPLNKELIAKKGEEGMSRPPVWQMIKEAIEALGGKATYGDIRDYIEAKFGDVNKSTITCQTIICSVNHPSRIHYPENKKPRVCKSSHDFLFNTGRGTVELYDQNLHGLWEISVSENGNLKVAQQGIEGGAETNKNMPLPPITRRREQIKLPRQQNLLLHSGSGKSPSV